MARETITIPISDLTGRMVMTVKVSGVQRFTWRVKFVIWLFGIAALIAPFGMLVTIDPPREGVK